MMTLTEAIAGIANSPLVAIDIETSGLHRNAEIVSIAFAWLKDEAELETLSLWIDRLDVSEETSKNIAAVASILDGTIFQPKFNGTAIFHNLNFDLIHLLRRFKPDTLFPSQILCRVTDTLHLQGSRHLRSH